MFMEAHRTITRKADPRAQIIATVSGTKIGLSISLVMVTNQRLSLAILILSTHNGNKAI